MNKTLNKAYIFQFSGSIAIFAAVLILAGCSIESPKAPSWDVPITVPLIDRSYTSAELFEKINSDNIEIADDGSASFVVHEQLADVGFGSILQFDDVHEMHSETIGLIKIVKADNQSISYRLEDYVSLIAGVVPETGATAVAEIGQPSSFSEAEFAEGTLGLSVSNNTGLALDEVTITLIDSYGEVIQHSIPGGLADGAAYDTELSVAGERVSGALSLETYFHTPGGSMLSLAERSLDVVLTYGEDLRATSITGQVDRFEQNYHEETQINEESEIITAQLNSGSLILDWSNDLPLPLDLSLSFPEITDGAGQMQINLSLAAGQHFNQSISLAGKQLTPVGNRLAVDVNATVQGSEGNSVTMSSSDQFSVEISLQDLQAETATAKLAPTEVSWDQTSIAIDVPTGFDNVSPAVVELEIVVQNYSELGGTVELELQADNGKQLTIQGEVDAGSPESPVESRIVSSQLAQLLSPIPNQISVGGMALVGDGTTIINLSGSDHLEASATINAPMSVTLDAATVEGDPNELEIDDDLSDKADRLLDGRFEGRISNHLPLGASVSIYFATSADELFTNPLTIIGPLAVNAGLVDDAGVVSQITETFNELNLTADNLAVFGHERLYIAPVIELQGSNGQVVHIRAEDYLEISGFITINTRLGGEDF